MHVFTLRVMKDVINAVMMKESLRKMMMMRRRMMIMMMMRRRRGRGRKKVIQRKMVSMEQKISLKKR